jgi:hypothetical protein
MKGGKRTNPNRKPSATSKLTAASDMAHLLKMLNQSEQVLLDDPKAIRDIYATISHLLQFLRQVSDEFGLEFERINSR